MNVEKLGTTFASFGKSYFMTMSTRKNVNLVNISPIINWLTRQLRKILK